jgi:hypothetical protein
MRQQAGVSAHAMILSVIRSMLEVVDATCTTCRVARGIAASKNGVKGV